MKNSLRPFILFWVAFVGLLGFSKVSNAQQFYTLTYSQGDIGGPANYTTATPTTCPGILTFNNIPLGMRVDSVQVSYDFFTSMAGFGNPGMQRSCWNHQFLRKDRFDRQWSGYRPFDPRIAWRIG